MNDLDLVRDWMPEVAAADDVRARGLAELRAQFGVEAGGPARPQRLGRRFGVRVMAASVLASLLVGGGLLWSRREVDRRVSEVKTVSVPRDVLGGGDLSGGPVNILVVGSDSRAGTNDPAFGDPAADRGRRSDTMILVHVDGTTVRALWIPRDLTASADPADATRLNAWFNEGPAALIAALRTRLGVSVDHFVEIGFGAFTKIVDILDGSRVTSPGRARDVYSGLDLPGPGCVTLDGRQALAWVRSRHLEVMEGGAWRSADLRSDLDRLDRQQAFVRAVYRAARRRVGEDPRAALALADALIPQLVVDSRFARSEILALVRVFLGLDPANLTTATLPVKPLGVSLLDLQEPDADAALAPFRGEPVPAAEPLAPTAPTAEC